MIKGAIFDFDDTLAYKKRKVDDVKACEFVRRNGYDVYHQEWNAARKFVFFIEYPRGKIRTYYDYFKRTFELLGIHPKKELIEKTVQYHRKHERYVFFNDVKFIKNFRVKKAIFTTIPTFRIDYLNLDQFDPVITGRESRRAKPHPAGFFKILKKWRLKPNEVVMIGNDLDIDIIPAKRVGIKTIFISREGKKCRKADYNIKSLKEIEKIIQKLKRS